MSSLFETICIILSSECESQEQPIARFDRLLPLLTCLKFVRQHFTSFPVNKLEKSFIEHKKSSIFPVFTPEVYYLSFIFSLQIRRQKNPPFGESCHKMGDDLVLFIFKTFYKFTNNHNDTCKNRKKK